MEELILTFTPEPSDYSKATHIYSLLYVKYFIPLVVIIELITGFLIAFNPLLLLLDDTFGIVTFIVFFLATVFVFTFLYFVKEKTLKQVKKYDEFFFPMSYKFDSEEIHFIDGFSDIKFKWNFFGKTVEIREYYLLIPAVNKRCFYFIPKRIFKDISSHDLFRTFLQSKIPLYIDNTTSITNKEPLFSGTPIPYLAYFGSIGLPIMINICLQIFLALSK